MVKPYSSCWVGFPGFPESLSACLVTMAAQGVSPGAHSIDYILNVTREIDNFFPGLFAYHNIRVYDEETTDLLAHWNEAYHFINKAK